MKLYTINATPIRKYKQLSAGETLQIKRGQTTLKEINNNRIDDYADLVSGMLAKYGVDGFTIYPVVGYWQGEQERSFKIEIANSNPIIIADICQELREMFNQDAVMLTNPDNSVEFI
jgi:hypothetical protein